MFNKNFNSKKENLSQNYSVDIQTSRENWIKNPNLKTSIDKLTKDNVLHYKTKLLNTDNYNDCENIDCAINLSVKLCRLIYENMVEIIDNYSVITHLTQDKSLIQNINDLKNTMQIDSLTMLGIYQEISGVELEKKPIENNTLPNSFCLSLKEILNKIDNTIALVIRLNKLLIIDNLNRQLNIIKDNLYLASYKLMQMQINCFY